MKSLYLFDDARAARWRPFSWTRPAGDLVLGACSFRERTERVLHGTCSGFIAPHLDGWDEPDAPAVIEPDSIDASVDRLYLVSRFAPAWSAAFEPPGEPAVLVSSGVPVGWWSPAGAAGPPAAFLSTMGSAPASLPRIELEGRLVEAFWELVTLHGAQLSLDMRHLARTGSVAPAGVTILGESGGAVRIDDGVVIEPGVLIDCSAGSVWFEEGARVCAFTRIAGPARIGPGTTLLGGTFDTVTVGPRCKVRGELESSVVLGYSNKAHDGFIGHAVIGRWVNLGALTTNSDLKNNYGAVRVTGPDGEVDTGSMKVGCFLGDHVKTAIGTLLNTGTVVGPGSNLFGSTPPPKHVLPFSWGNTGDAVHALDRFLQTAELAMGRRDIPLTAGVRSVLEHAWQSSRGGTKG